MLIVDVKPSLQVNTLYKIRVNILLNEPRNYIIVNLQYLVNVQLLVEF